MRNRVEILINKDGKLFLGQNPRHLSWVFPGGGIEPGESILEAAKREAKEEAGMKLKNIRLLKVEPTTLQRSKTTYVLGDWAGDYKIKTNPDNDTMEGHLWEHPRTVKTILEKATNPGFEKTTLGRWNAIDVAFGEDLKKSSAEGFFPRDIHYIVTPEGEIQRVAQRPNNYLIRNAFRPPYVLRFYEKNVPEEIEIRDALYPGKGLFLRKPFKKGDRVFKGFYPEIPMHSYLSTRIGESPVSPNVEIDEEGNFQALRDLAEGEELLTNYSRFNKVYKDYLDKYHDPDSMVRTITGPSLIDGTGLFAKNSMEKGEYVTDETFSKYAYIQHSWEPNTELTKEGEVRTIRPVQEGEELTIQNPDKVQRTKYPLTVFNWDRSKKFNTEVLSPEEAKSKYSLSEFKQYRNNALEGVSEEENLPWEENELIPPQEKDIDPFDELSSGASFVSRTHPVDDEYFLDDDIAKMAAWEASDEIHLRKISSLEDKTVGQLLVNEILPPEVRDYTRVMNKKGLQGALKQVAEKYPGEYETVINKLQELGGREALFSSKQVTFSDFESPIDPKPYLKEAEQNYKSLLSKYGDKSRALAEAYSSAKEKLTKDSISAGVAKKNTFALMVASDARGKPAQFTDMLVAPLMVSDYKNKPIPIIIDRGYNRGLKPAQTFAASYGTRRGMISTKLAVPLGGYMSKMMNWTMNPEVVTMEDCGTKNGVSYLVSDPGNIGKYEAKTNIFIDANYLANFKGDKIVVRSPLSCEAEEGICKKCLGATEKGTNTPIGYNAGSVAASALSEPLSQSMLSEKHTGGAIKKQEGGYPLIKKLVEIPDKFPGKATLSEDHGVVSGIEAAPWGGWFISVGDRKHYTPQDNPPVVKKGDTVEKGDPLSEGIKNPAEVTSLRGIGEGRRELAQSLREAFSPVGGKNHDRSHYEIAAKAFVNFGTILGGEKIGGVFPGEVGRINQIQKEVSFDDAKGTRLAKDKTYFGTFLAKPALHFSMGTELTPKVVRELVDNGYSLVETTEKRAPFEPTMVRIQDTAGLTPDWVTRLGSQGLKRSIQDALYHGQKSKTKDSVYFMHPYILGREFGKGKLY